MTDKAGRSVRVPPLPARVVVLDFGPIIASLVEMGLTPIGATSNAVTTDFSARFGPAAASIVDVGNVTTVNLERVAELTPDLILTNTTYVDVDVEPLQRIAPTVAFEGPNRYLDILRFHAEVIGRSERAEPLSADFAAELMRSPARQQVAGRRVALVSVRDGSFTLFGPVLQFGVLIEALSGQVFPAGIGGKALTDASDDLSLEVLSDLLGEADLIVLLRDFAGPDSDAEVASTQSSPLWAEDPRRPARRRAGRRHSSDGGDRGFRRPASRRGTAVHRTRRALIATRTPNPIRCREAPHRSADDRRVRLLENRYERLDRLGKPVRAGQGLGVPGAHLTRLHRGQAPPRREVLLQLRRLKAPGPIVEKDDVEVVRASVLPAERLEIGVVTTRVQAEATTVATTYRPTRDLGARRR